MKIGINTFLFCSPFNNDHASYFQIFKNWGFDFVEIAVENSCDIDPEYIRQELLKCGLECRSICAATGPGRDLRGSITDQKATISYIKELIDIAVILGSKIVVGPMYSSVGRANLETKEDKVVQRELVVSNLRLLAAYASEKQVLLCLEPLNRYETDFMNTCEQALQVIEEVGSAALRVHLDTFHMNLEEKDPAKAIKLANENLGLLHASGSDRGTPGGDQINWQRIFDALKEIDYQGDIVIESFSPDVKVIAKAASIWREVEPSKASIGVDGLKFLKGFL